MRPTLTLMLIMMWSVGLTAQNFHVLHVEEVNPNWTDDVYTFPLLEGPDTNIIAKVNSHLLWEQLDMELGKQQVSIFENVWQTADEPIARVNYLTYQVELLTDTLYSVTISGEGCGAYCEGFDMTYTFDLSNGQFLSLPDLFTTEGQKALLHELSEYKAEQINKKILELKGSLMLDTMSTEDREMYTEMLELYQNCDSEYDDLEYFRFIPSRNELTIIYGRCSAHYNRAVDDLWYFKNTISLDDWKTELSETGRKVFGH